LGLQTLISSGTPVLPDPRTAFQTGAFARVPLLSGNVADEGTVFSRSPLTLQQYEALLIATFHDNSTIAKIVERYPCDTSGNCQSAYGKALGMSDGSINFVALCQLNLGATGDSTLICSTIGVEFNIVVLYFCSFAL
jgi:carboxylesterase type B